MLSQIFRSFAKPGVVALVVFYLGFHVLSGDRGLYALLKENRRVELTRSELTRVKQDREKMEHRVRLLSTNSLDLDMLDQQARAVIGLSKSQEVVYFPAEGQ